MGEVESEPPRHLSSAKGNVETGRSFQVDDPIRNLVLASFCICSEFCASFPPAEYPWTYSEVEGPAGGRSSLSLVPSATRCFSAVVCAMRWKENEWDEKDTD